MREQISNLTQSRFFSPAFNGAIFDGPIRIYFSQSQEAAAMKMYFAVLARVRSQFGELKDTGVSQNIFILIYPTPESFKVVFPSDARPKTQVDRLDDDHIIGICGPMDEAEFPQFFVTLDVIMSGLSRSSELAEL